MPIFRFGDLSLGLLCFAVFLTLGFDWIGGQCARFLWMLFAFRAWVCWQSFAAKEKMEFAFAR